MRVVVVIECTVMSILPIQLAKLFPSTVATLIEEMCEMSPGVPWSVQILNDLIRRLETNWMIRSTIMFSPHNVGITEIQVSLVHEPQTKKKEGAVHASVMFFNGRETVLDSPQFGWQEKRFPKTRLGLKQAIE